MLVVREIDAMRDEVAKLRRRCVPSGRNGFVPTMGAIHAGHLSLVEQARRQCDHVTASIFVNPLQFGPTEDLARYPRPFEADCAQFEAAGVDLLFAPSAETMYPHGTGTLVEVPGIGDRLDGSSRPGHFRGVATVVLKLLNIVAADRVFFGQKDAAQLAVLRAMVRDLNLPVRLVACPIVREPDGLAMSSRNRYLSPVERLQALLLHRALQQAERLFHAGEDRALELEAALRGTLATEPALRVDYAAVVAPDTLLPVERVARTALVAVAVWVGTTRLIDNVVLEIAPRAETQSGNAQYEGSAPCHAA